MTLSNSLIRRPDAQQLLARLSRQGEARKPGRPNEAPQEKRALLSIGILVVPLNDESPEMDKAFTALEQRRQQHCHWLGDQSFSAHLPGLAASVRQLGDEIASHPRSATAKNWGKAGSASIWR